MTITPRTPTALETDRLTLRRPAASDAEAIFERYASDSDVTRFVGWPRHRSLDDTKAFLRFSEQEWEQRPAGPYLITARADGPVIGGTGLAFQAPPSHGSATRNAEAMTGYVLAKDAWGRGYATEALLAIVGVAARLGLTRLSAFCHPEHLASRRVLEKCGFVHDVTSMPHIEFPNLSPGVVQEAVCYAVALQSGEHRAG